MRRYLFRLFYIFFFFKQKTAYEMSLRDWSSDVCSSDLRQERPADRADPARHSAQRTETDCREPHTRVEAGCACARSVDHKSKWHFRLEDMSPYSHRSSANWLFARSRTVSD